MAKESMKAREVKRKKIVDRYAEKTEEDNNEESAAADSDNK